MSADFRGQKWHITGGMMSGLKITNDIESILNFCMQYAMLTHFDLL